MIAASVALGRAVAQKSAAVGQKLFSRGLVQRGALRLIKRAFIPIDAEPVKAVDDALDEFRLVALGVSILDAQDHGATLMASKKPVEQSGARAADVQIASR